MACSAAGADVSPPSEALSGGVTSPAAQVVTEEPTEMRGEVRIGVAVLEDSAEAGILYLKQGMLFVEILRIDVRGLCRCAASGGGVHRLGCDDPHLDSGPGAPDIVTTLSIDGQRDSETFPGGIIVSRAAELNEITGSSNGPSIPVFPSTDVDLLWMHGDLTATSGDLPSRPDLADSGIFLPEIRCGETAATREEAGCDDGGLQVNARVAGTVFLIFVDSTSLGDNIGDTGTGGIALHNVLD